MAVLQDARQMQTEQEDDFLTMSSTPASNDPWSTNKNESNGAWENAEGSGNFFPDSFRPPIEKLPDSKEYIGRLEAKLNRVQKKGSLLRDLQKKREDEMRRFVDDQDDASRRGQSDWARLQDADVACATTENPILRIISPDKQVKARCIYTLFLL